MAPNTTKDAPLNINKASISANRTRSLIVDSACQIIAENGYDALTAAALSERAGVSKGGLYHHFQGMKDVVIAAYKETSLRVFSVLATGHPKSFDEYLDEVEHVVFERLLKDPKTVRIISELYPKLMFDPSYRQPRKESFEKIMAKTAGLLNESFRTKVDQKQLMMAVNSVAVFVSGLTVQNREVRDLKQSRELWQWFRDALIAKLASHRKIN